MGSATRTEAGLISLTTAFGNGADARVRGGAAPPSTAFPNPPFSPLPAQSTAKDFNFGGSDVLSVRLARLPPGTAGNLAARTAAQLNNSQKSYLKFDVSTIDPATATLAQLHLTLTNTFTIDPSAPGGGVTFQLYGLNNSLIGDSWIEGTQTGQTATGGLDHLG